MSNEKQTNDLLRLIKLHYFHNPLEPRVCELCRIEEQRRKNTPTVRWTKALKTVSNPPTPIGIMLTVILALILALAVTI